MTLPPLGGLAEKLVDIKQARWVCGPARCAYLPNYAGAVVVHPYMRECRPPPKPHCMYVRGPEGRWALVCP
jgi:hypothetical protein